MKSLFSFSVLIFIVFLASCSNKKAEAVLPKRNQNAIMVYKLYECSDCIYSLKELGKNSTQVLILHDEFFNESKIEQYYLDTFPNFHFLSIEKFHSSDAGVLFTVPAR